MRIFPTSVAVPSHTIGILSLAGDSAGLRRVQDMLIRGKKEEAAKEAAFAGHFAVSLMLASMCGPKFYQQSIANFADKALRSGSPLHTISMLFSSQVQPPKKEDSNSSFWGSDPDELRNSWRSHLAAIINNRSRGWDIFGVSLGDQLLRIGETEAAHFCYVFCGCPVASVARRDSRLTLLGCDITPGELGLTTKESMLAFERTEAYEWAKRRGNPAATIQCLQPFKLLYAMLLADCGLESSARSYLQTIEDSLQMVKAKSTTGPLSLALISSDAEILATEVHAFRMRLSRGFLVDNDYLTAEQPSRPEMDTDSSFMTAHSSLVDAAKKPSTVAKGGESRADVSSLRQSGPTLGWSHTQDTLQQQATESGTQPFVSGSSMPPGEEAMTPVREDTEPSQVVPKSDQAPRRQPFPATGGNSSGTEPFSPQQVNDVKPVKPKSAPMSAPANLQQGSNDAAPSSGKSKCVWLIAYTNDSIGF